MLPELHEFSNVAGCQNLYIQKSVALLYTNNKLSERNKENNPIPRNKSKEVKDLCSENC